MESVPRNARLEPGVLVPAGSAAAPSVRETAPSWTTRARGFLPGMHWPDARVLTAIALSALAWRALSAGLAFLANVLFPLAAPEQFTVTGRTHLFWDAMARFDSGWYFGIARNGYAFVEGGRSNLAFFPTYPMSMGYLGYWMGGGIANYYYAGVIISWAAFAAAMVILYRLARLDMGRDEAARACVYASVFPFAFFFGMVYPSSLFLLLCVLSFYAFRKGHWVTGALAGALVTCTRVNGILIMPALAVLLYQVWRHEPRQFRRGAAALAFVPAGLLAYAIFNYSQSGSFFEFAASISRWDYSPGGAPWAAFTALLTNLPVFYSYLAEDGNAPYDLLNGLAAMAALVAVPFVWRRFGAPYALFILLNLLLPLSTGHLVGLGRYTAVLFPMYLWLATLRSPLWQSGLIALFAMLYMLCQSLFVNLHPIF
jgi:hypothetical protein